MVIVVWWTTNLTSQCLAFDLWPEIWLLFEEARFIPHALSTLGCLLDFIITQIFHFLFLFISFLWFSYMCIACVFQSKMKEECIQRLTTCKYPTEYPYNMLLRYLFLHLSSTSNLTKLWTSCWTILRIQTQVSACYTYSYADGIRSHRPKFLWRGQSIKMKDISWLFRVQCILGKRKVRSGVLL